MVNMHLSLLFWNVLFFIFAFYAMRIVDILKDVSAWIKGVDLHVLTDQ